MTCVKLASSIASACLLLSVAAGAFEAHADTTPPRIPDSWASPGIDDPPGPTKDVVARQRVALPMIAGPAGLFGTVGSPGMQAEISLAGHAGTLLVGANDVRYATLGGYMRSLDGGDTWADGAPFPFALGWTGNGDPAMAVWDDGGSPIFFWAQLATSPGGQRQIVLFRTVDGGLSWSGPFTITPTAIPGESPDRHSIAVDPETGRLIVAWTHFGTPFSIRVTYSDDADTGLPPTWAAAAFVGARPQDGQATSLAVDPATNDVYLAWMTYWGGLPDRGVALVKSTTNATTWGAPTDIFPLFNAHIAPFGFDRFLWSLSGSSIAWNAVTGALVMVYGASATGSTVDDFGDIIFRRSTDGGLTWSPGAPLNVFPGTDRAQCFPAVTCTPAGRIDVTWYDQSAGSGRSDDTDLMYCYSEDNGVTWSSPVPVTPAPMHCESGNNFSFPHQGDYNDVSPDEAPAVTTLSYAGFTGFAEPGPFTTGADPMGFRSTGAQYAPLRIRPGSVLVEDTGCGTDDGRLVAAETGRLTIPLENIGRVGLTSISATLSTSAFGVAVTVPTRAYAAIASGGTGLPVAPFEVLLAPGFPCGEDIVFRLDISASGVLATYREFTVPTGVLASSTVLLDEDFDGAVPPAPPPGWSALNLGSVLNNWVTTAASPASPPNAAFIPISFGNSFGRLQGPVVATPPGTHYIEVTFDTQHDLREHNPRYAPDGGSFNFHLNGVGGSHFGSGDASEIDYRYTHNVERASGGNAGDRHAWSGISTGYVAARFRIPDMAGQTITPRFDFTTTGGGAGGVGWWVDNVKITAYTLGCGACSPTPTLIQRFVVAPKAGGVELEWASDAGDQIVAWKVYRGASLEGVFECLTSEPIPMGPGGTFRLFDAAAPAGRVYYRLAAIAPTGSEHTLETVYVEVEGRAFSAVLTGPNPFQNGTSLRYTLPATGAVRIELFSASGQRIRRIVNGVLPAGTHPVMLDRVDASGARLPAGIYLVRVQAAGRSRTLRVAALD